MRYVPKPGHVWLDTDADEEGGPRRSLEGIPEIIFLVNREKKDGWQDVWYFLVSRADGTCWFDWDHVDVVQEWYDHPNSFMKRVI